jgi:hypothetical protein
MNVNAQLSGSTRVSRVAFGIAPKPTLPLREHVPSCELQRKVRDREGALASPRDSCAPQT